MGVTGRLNTRKYFWLVLGYYLCTVYVRQSMGAPDTDIKSHLNFGEPGYEAPIVPSTLVDEGTEHVEESTHSDHGIQITRVDFENVETPFIIALWIFCASLAKIGKFIKIINALV